MARILFKTALVLSGGSARGLTHLGVLEEIQRRRFPVDLIVGTSMGAMVGALYAYYGDVSAAIGKMKRLIESDLFLNTISVMSEDNPALGADGFFNRFMLLFRKGVYYTHSMLRHTLVDEQIYNEIMSSVIPDVLIEDLPLRFAAVALDVVSGEEIVITRGPLIKAVAASAAIPGLLPPVHHFGRILVDGGWSDNIPVAPAIALGAHYVLASDATLDISGLGPPAASAIENLFRCNEITRITLMKDRRSAADSVIVPAIGEMSWSDFSSMQRCLKEGREAFRKNATHVYSKQSTRRLLTLWGTIHPGRRMTWRHPFIVY